MCRSFLTERKRKRFCGVYQIRKMGGISELGGRGGLESVEGD